MPKKRTQSTLSFAPSTVSTKKSKPSPNLKILTWNVNGLRAFIKKSAGGELKFEHLLRELAPDVVCLQETKIDDSLVSEYEHFLGPAFPFSTFLCCTTKKGYSGTAVFSKVQPIKVLTDFPLNDEGRVIACEFESCIVVNTYVPNSGMKLERLEYRTKVWDVAMHKYLRDLDASSDKPVIWTGDLNVAHGDNDVAYPAKKRNKTPGFHDDERENMGLLVGGAGHVTEEQKKKRTALVGRPGPTKEELAEPQFIDVFSMLNGNWEDNVEEKEDSSTSSTTPSKPAPPSKRRATFWSYRFQAKVKDNGWRLDYFIVSKTMASKILQCDVCEHYWGLSDHVPLVLEFQK